MPKSQAARVKARLVRKAKVAAGLVPPRRRKRGLTGGGAYNPVSGAPRRMLTGRGDYKDWLKYIPRAIGGAAGFATGGLAGATKGWETGAGLSKIMGLGAYNRRPLIPGFRPGGGQRKIFADPVPYISTDNESCTLSRVEYMGDVICSGTAGAFNNVTYAFNPGIMLNWGASMASLFQEWRLDGAVVSFRSRASSYTSSTTLGTVMIAMDYNATASAFTTKQQMQECGGVASSSIDRDCDCYIECARNQTPESTLYVRTGAVPSGQDAHNYDMGLLQVATSGCAASANIGELYISYRITFRKPVAVGGSMIPSAHYTLTTPTDAAPFGTARTKVVDTIGATFTNTVMTLPAGTSGIFWLHRYLVGTTASVAYPAITLSNATGVTLENGAASAFCPGNGTSSTSTLVDTYFQITNPSVSTTVTISGGTMPTSVTNADLWLTELNSSAA